MIVISKTPRFHRIVVLFLRVDSGGFYGFRRVPLTNERVRLSAFHTSVFRRDFGVLYIRFLNLCVRER